MTITAAVVVASDQASRGLREDASGPAAQTALGALGCRVEPAIVVPDRADAIAQALRQCVTRGVQLVLTSGGTGFGPRDVTPEATRAVLEREAEGLAEFLRRETAKQFPMAVLGRGRAGIAGQTLIINAPGSPRGVVQYIEALGPLLPHMVELIQGQTEHGDSEA